MVGQEETPPIPNENKKPALCQECDSNPWKYRCPGCAFVSCSLPCVNAHKARTGCTGKRPRTDFVPLTQFDDNILLSDYNFLEETKRAAEAAQRMIVKFGRDFRFKLPFWLQELHKAAKQRRTCLLFMPMGMSKRVNNQTQYIMRTKCIHWTLEFRFHQTDAVIVEHGVNEHATLYSVLDKHLKPNPWNNQLRHFCNVELENLKFFVQKNAKRKESPYRRLNLNDPLRWQLKNLLILEYPVVYVFLPSQNHDFQVENQPKAIQYKEPPLFPGIILNPKGTVFKEEEIEEGEMLPETRVADFSDYAKMVPSNILPCHNGSSALLEQGGHQNLQKADARADDLKLLNSGCQAANEGNNTLSSLAVNPEGLEEDETFEFEQDLRDAYSSLFGEINPDEFLCLDGLDDIIGNDEEQLQYYTTSFEKELQGDEELEEGEIPSH